MWRLPLSTLLVLILLVVAQLALGLIGLWISLGVLGWLACWRVTVAIERLRQELIEERRARRPSRAPDADAWSGGGLGDRGA
jgi:hypothetical protein